MEGTGGVAKKGVDAINHGAKELGKMAEKTGKSVRINEGAKKLGKMAERTGKSVRINEGAKELGKMAEKSVGKSIYNSYTIQQFRLFSWGKWRKKRGNR
jgi:hypothetical protein